LQSRKLEVAGKKQNWRRLEKVSIGGKLNIFNGGEELTYEAAF
jgi:hypothetical protein